MHVAPADGLGHAPGEERLAVALDALQHDRPLELDARVLNDGGHIAQDNSPVPFVRQQSPQVIQQQRRVAFLARDLRGAVGVDAGSARLDQDVGGRQVRPEAHAVDDRALEHLRLGEGLERVARGALVALIHRERVAAELRAEPLGRQQPAAGHQNAVQVDDVDAAGEQPLLVGPAGERRALHGRHPGLGCARRDLRQFDLRRLVLEHVALHTAGVGDRAADEVVTAVVPFLADQFRLAHQALDPGDVAAGPETKHLGEGRVGARTVVGLLAVGVRRVGAAERGLVGVPEVGE